MPVAAVGIDKGQDVLDQGRGGAQGLGSDGGREEPVEHLTAVLGGPHAPSVVLAHLHRDGAAAQVRGNGLQRGDGAVHVRQGGVPARQFPTHEGEGTAVPVESADASVPGNVGVGVPGGGDVLARQGAGQVHRGGREQVHHGTLGDVLQGASEEVEFRRVEAVAEGVERPGEVVDVVAVEGSGGQGEDVVQRGGETREGVGCAVLDGGGHVFQDSRTSPVATGRSDRNFVRRNASPCVGVIEPCG